MILTVSCRGNAPDRKIARTPPHRYSAETPLQRASGRRRNSTAAFCRYLQLVDRRHNRQKATAHFLNEERYDGGLRRTFYRVHCRRPTAWGHHFYREQLSAYGWFAAIKVSRNQCQGVGAITMLVDSGATEKFMDNEFLPDVQSLIPDSTVLDKPNQINTAGQQLLLGTARGISKVFLPTTRA